MTLIEKLQALKTPPLPEPDFIRSGTVMARTAVRTITYLSVGNQYQRCIGFSSLRVGIGFFLGSGAVTTGRVYPMAWVAPPIGWLTNPNVPLWFSLHEYGPLVCQEWYIVNHATDPLYILEAYKLP